MIMKNILKVSCLCLCAAVLSCSKNPSEGPNAALERYFNAWMDINYPGATGMNGVYVVEDQPGTGAVWSKDLPVTFISYTVRNLSGTVTANSDEAWAKQLGSWNQTYYYGQQVAMTGEGASYAGVDAILQGMRAGGTRTAVVPAWMMTYERYDDVGEYLQHTAETNAAIYTIRFLGQTDDLPKYEYNRLRDYSIGTWGVSDTLSTSAVFFKSFTDFDGEPGEMPSDTTVYINYTGRRISDGQVFDTTVADTAKLYNIYNPSKTYAPVSVTWGTEADKIKLSGNEPIKGFAYGLYAMHPGEKASFAFCYTLGYGANGGSDKNMVPPYAALRFDIELVPEP